MDFEPKINKIDTDLKIYRAIAYDFCSSKGGDDRLQVRILPLMAEVTEVSLLPKFPMLFRGQVIKCKTEKADGVENAQKLFVIANKYFTYGYILGEINEFAGITDKDAGISHYNFLEISNIISMKNLSVKNINYNDLNVTNYVTSDKGGFIEFYNYKTGDKYTLNASGTLFAITQKEIKMSVGSPDKKGGKRDYSEIIVAASSIKMKSRLIDIDAKNLILGHHGLNVAGFSGVMPVQVQGQNIRGIPNVKI